VPHDDGETKNAQGAPKAMPSASETGSTNEANSGTDTSSGEGANSRIYNDLGSYGAGILFGVESTAPAVHSLFANLVPNNITLSGEILAGIRDSVKSGADLCVMIPVAYWCQEGRHIVYVEAVLRSDEDEPVCPDHHIVVEQLYTRKKLG
jgi:hypothetical protein